MSLIVVVLLWALVGFVTWLVVTYIPMPPLMARLIVIFVALVFILWILSYLFPEVAAIRIGP